MIPGRSGDWTTARLPDPGFGLYVHWPFCAKKCPYCDFNSHVDTAVDHARWRTALLAELDRMAALTPGRTLSTIYFGGGTPSLMDPQTTADLIAAARTRWTPTPDMEITLEANPGTVDESRFAAFADAGVNRVSLGVQALNDQDLGFLGRIHDATDARRALIAAGRHFNRVSLDLIYARPGQSLEAWEAELAAAINLLDDIGGDHLSLYQLTIEKGTAFFTDHRAGRFRLPEEDLAADLYDATDRQTRAAGIPRYEVSNHARPGGESRHNLIYWRGGDWVGIGPGAHGRLSTAEGRRAEVATGTPARWLAAVLENGSGEASHHIVPPEDHGRELAMMALRTAEGLHRGRLAALTGCAADSLLDPAAITDMTEEGFLAADGPWLRATDDGIRLLNAVLNRMLL